MPSCGPGWPAWGAPRGEPSARRGACGRSSRTSKPLCRGAAGPTRPSCARPSWRTLPSGKKVWPHVKPRLRRGAVRARRSWHSWTRCPASGSGQPRSSSRTWASRGPGVPPRRRAAPGPSAARGPMRGRASARVGGPAQAPSGSERSSSQVRTPRATRKGRSSAPHVAGVPVGTASHGRRSGSRPVVWRPPTASSVPQSPPGSGESSTAMRSPGSTSSALMSDAWSAWDGIATFASFP